MDRRLIIVVIITIIIFMALNAIPPPPEDTRSDKITVPIDKTVEKGATREGLSVFKVSSLKNQFTEFREYQGLIDSEAAGAGGMGNAIISVDSAQEMLEIAKANHVDNIYYAETVVIRNYTKVYWVLLPAGTILSYTVSYSPPNGYIIETYTPNETLYLRKWGW